VAGHSARKRIGALLPQSLIDLLVRLEIGARAFADAGGRYPRECPVCGFHGLFWAAGHQPLIFDARCPRCRSIGRFRQHELLMRRYPGWLDGQQVLHFAPETCFADAYAERIAATGGRYVQAEYNPSAGQTKVDIQGMQFGDGEFDTIICHNVLEHVRDDRKAMAEMFRVVRPSGRVLVSVPMVDAWTRTYEDPAMVSAEARDLHFNQDDHLRLYGRDFYDLMRSVGFAIEAYTASEPEVSRYALERGETIFIGTRS
jgi:SAM-dependent methyltransferase